MYNNDESKPFIFTKILKGGSKIESFNKVINTLGSIRYFPPTNQEWDNSIYTYDNSYIKNVTVANKNLNELIKSYFNLYFSNEIITNKRMTTRFKRLAISKIFVSKAILKHTNTKVLITLYVYNEEQRILAHRIKRIENILFVSPEYSSLKLYKNGILTIKDKLDILKQGKENNSIKFLMDKLRLSISEEINLEKNNLVKIKNLNNKNEKQLIINTLEKNLKDIINMCENKSINYKYYEDISKRVFRKILLDKEFILIAYYKLLLYLNKSKFEDNFIL